MGQRTWLVTGVSSGLGRVLAEKLLARGDQVAGTVLEHVSVLDDLKNKYRERLWLARLDLSETASISAVVNGAWQAFGSVDALISNAGYGLTGAAEEASDDEVRHLIDTNLLGSIQLVRAALPHMRQQGHGRIIQVSSMGGQIAVPGWALYHATKWGIEGFVESVAQEVASFGIQFTIVEPGAIRTGFRQNTRIAAKMGVYDGSPSRLVSESVVDPNRPSRGDPERMADLMIATADQTAPPRRIALGSDAYEYIHVQLAARMHELERLKEASYSTDFPSA